MDSRLAGGGCGAMPKFRVCTYCGVTIEPGTGVMYVLRNGQIIWFCSSKCFKSYVKLRRRADRQEWVRKLRRALGGTL